MDTTAKKKDKLDGDGRVNMGFRPDNSSTVSFSGSAGDDISKISEDEAIDIDIIDKEDVKDDYVVMIRHAMKRYGNGPKILNDFGMTVRRGCIYSLLGASGCGKTTVLACILGLRRIQSGKLLVFGEKPGTDACGVPGKRAGYMPQDISLYNSFTIKETLQYYGTLYGMSRKQIAEKVKFLVTFLDLPDPKMRVGNLSGGQKRRVSLSVALVHSPELIILDEPTVGVDSLLREKIWSHLVLLASEQKASIIITTHYIEEARQSNMVGFLREGRLLEEKDPSRLLQEHNTTLLEDIVLKVCRNDELGDGKYCYSKDVRRRSRACDEIATFKKDREPPTRKEKCCSSLSRIKALLLKNTFVMMRNFLLVLFMIFVPTIIVALICAGIGNDPRPMNLGVVNNESTAAHCDDVVHNMTKYDKGGCHIQYLSCQYLELLPSDIIHRRHYNGTKEAVDAVRNGRVWGYVTFSNNFSEDLFQRFLLGANASVSVLHGSTIEYALDMTSKQIAGSLVNILNKQYDNLIHKMLKSCNFSAELGDPPVKALEPILGDADTTFREFIAPSLLMALLFFFPLCSSSNQYIYDKKLGTLERAEVAGVSTGEIIIAFFISEGFVLVLQSALTLLLIAFAFEITIKGSLTLVFILTISMGIGGVSMGFVIASFCNEEVQAVMLAMASFFPSVILSGLIWPIEGLPGAMQFFSYLLPCTFPAEAVRSIISRGWGFTHSKVYPGFLTIFAWISIYWIVTVFVHKIVLSRK